MKTEQEIKSYLERERSRLSQQNSYDEIKGISERIKVLKWVIEE
jgi:hypothetical protein